MVGSLLYSLRRFWLDVIVTSHGDQAKLQAALRERIPPSAWSSLLSTRRGEGCKNASRIGEAGYNRWAEPADTIRPTMLVAAVYALPGSSWI